MINWAPIGACFKESFCERYLISGAADKNGWSVILAVRTSKPEYDYAHEGKGYKEVFTAKGKSENFKDATSEATRLAEQIIKSYEDLLGRKEEKIGNLSLIDDPSGKLSISCKLKEMLR